MIAAFAVLIYMLVGAVVLRLFRGTDFPVLDTRGMVSGGDNLELALFGLCLIMWAPALIVFAIGGIGAALVAALAWPFRWLVGK